MPPLEEAGPPGVAAEFARIANDEMAALVRQFPDRSAGFAAALPMCDVGEAARELDRSLTQLGALGAQPGRPRSRHCDSGEPDRVAIGETANGRLSRLRFHNKA